MAKILCVLYDDPIGGYPPQYARDDVPKIESYHGGQTAPSPKAIDFTPGELLGCVSGALGLRSFLESAGHTLVVTSDKDGDDSEFDRNLHDADVVISQPFWPAYMTAERFAKAPNLKLVITAETLASPGGLTATFVWMALAVVLPYLAFGLLRAAPTQPAAAGD